LVGTLRLVSSRINHSANGFEVWGVRDSQSIIGGSPANGNVFEDSELGGVFLDVDHSLIEYSHNNVTLAPDLPYNGLSILQGVLWMPQKPAQFFIQHNTIRVKGGFENGILILDRGPLFGVGKTGNFLIADNAIQLGGSESNPAYAGIESIFAVDAVISNNKISGEGALMGISAEASLHCTLKANNVQQLRPILFPVALLGVNSGFAWNTSDCTVVGGNNKTNIYDEGTSNTLVGVNNMQGNPPGPAFREARQQKRDLRKMLHR